MAWFPNVFRRKGDGIEDELRIVLIGKTGCGKSATGNTILGEKSFYSKFSTESVTKKCAYTRVKRFGNYVAVVDTPGLFDTVTSDEVITEEIGKCILITSPGPHALVLVILAGRFTKEEQDTVQKFHDIFGDEMYKYLIVLITRKDDLKRDDIDVNNYTKEATPELKELLIKCNGNLIAFDNAASRGNREKDAKALIKMVQDIVRKNTGRCYTNEMYEKAEQRMKSRIEEIKKQKDLEKEEELKKAVEEHLNKAQIAEIEKKHEYDDTQIREVVRNEIQSDQSGFSFENVKGIVMNAVMAGVNYLFKKPA